jgi:hypothetical protein
MYDETTINGITYITDAALCAGDYSGCGSVGEANLRTIEALADDDDIDQMHTTHSHFERMRKGWAWEGDDEIDAPIVFLRGAYGSRSAWVRADHDELSQIVNALSDYALIDEEECSRVETEWEDEAWESWLRSDLLRTLEDGVEDRLDALATFGAAGEPQDLESLLWSAYRQAMDRENEYPTPEGAGVHVAVDRIADTFGTIVGEYLEQYTPHAGTFGTRK